MAFTFDIKKPDNLQEVLSQIERDIKKEGGTFRGDVTSGDISINTPLGEVKGSYKAGDDLIKITITKKPLVVTESRVKEELKKYFDKYTKK